MKKIINLLSAAIVAIAFSACSDVPAPYDINNGTGGGDASTYVSESFSSGFGSFKVKTVKGTPWVIDYSTAKASGYDNDSKTNTESESYLVSKTIDLSQSTGAYIEFEYILRYASSGTNKVLITDNYTDDPETTTWTDITGKLTEGSDWNTFEIYLKNIPEEFIGKPAVNIAFYYYASSSNSATWEVKNVKVKEGAAEDSNGGEEQEPTGEGTRDNPFNVATAISTAQGQTGWVKGYIVGYVDDSNSIQNGSVFAIPETADTEILLADTPDETIGTNCIPVQLPIGDIRNALELHNNPHLYKKEVMLYGSFEKYFGVGGLKSTSAAIIDGTLIGTDPDNNTPDVPSELTGDGTLENPYNVADARIVTGKLASNEKSTEKYYIKGKISSIKYTFSADYGTATFDISDEGVDNSFTAYSILYLGNRSWTNGDLQVAVGDEVILYGTVTNYNGTLETASRDAYIYSLNGKTSDEGGNDDNTGSGDTSSDGKANVSKSGNIVTMTDTKATASTSTITCDLNEQGWTKDGEDVTKTKITLNDGTTIEFAKGTGSNTPVFYTATKGVRVYANNTITINGSKRIASIVLKCDTYSGVDQTGHDGLYADIDGTTWKVVNYSPANSGGQLRVQTITITYAQ